MALVKEQEWAIKVRKYGGRINLGETTKDKLTKFIKIKIYIYKKKDFLDNTLWTIFQEEFKKFTLEDFQKIHSDTKAKLQKYLFKKGVCVTKHNTRITLSNILFNIIQKEE